MEDFSLLGNAAAIPVIVMVTQYVKNNFSFAAKRKSDFISALVALVICFGWDFFYLPTEELVIVWSGGFIPVVKHLVDLMIVSGATWVSANKSYDLFLGNKKRTERLDQHTLEKEQLSKEIEVQKEEVIKLRNGNGHKTEKVPESDEISDELRAILEG